MRPVTSSTPAKIPRLPLEIRPEPDEEERAALLEAIDPGPTVPPAYESPWRLAGQREAAEVDP